MKNLLSTAAAREFRADVLRSENFAKLSPDRHMDEASDCFVLNDPEGRGTLLYLDMGECNGFAFIRMDRRLLKKIKGQFEIADRCRRMGDALEPEQLEDRPDMVAIFNPHYRKEYPLQPEGSE